jgi:transposase, IS5 family
MQRLGRIRVEVLWQLAERGIAMGQMGFFDVANRYAGLDAKADPLVKLTAIVPWEDFRPRLEEIWRRSAADKKSPAGRKPWDAVVIFKAIVLCELYNLSDEQLEYQLRDRLSFMRFLGLGLEARVPDATTVWLYREQLVQAAVVEELFAAFDGYLREQGWLAMGGQMIDASIVPVPRQRNGREENAKIKAGETPEGWDDRPAKRRQKDTDARWTKKHGKSHYGYKNHVNVDRRHKLIRRYTVTDASVHDSRPLKDVLDADNTASDVWADSAYRSAETEEKLAARGLRSRIHRKAHRNRPLSEREKQGNKTRSKVRARVEHVFGAQANDMGGTLLRCIGIARAKARIGLKNLAYNMRRAVHLDGIAAARAPT